MRLYFAKLFRLYLLCSMAALLSTAMADDIPLKAGQRVRASDLKGLDWYPLIRFDAHKSGVAAGLLYVTMKTTTILGDIDRLQGAGSFIDLSGLKRFPFFDKFYLLHDWKNGLFDVVEVFEFHELSPGKVLAKVKNAPLVGDKDILTVRFKKLLDGPADLTQGLAIGIEMKILRDATALLRNSYVTRSFALEISSGRPFVSYDGQEIYSIGIAPNRRYKREVGISKLFFYDAEGKFFGESPLL